MRALQLLSVRNMLGALAMVVLASHVVASENAAKENITPRALIDAYIAAWSETDEGQRKRQLADIFVAEGMHKSPTTHSVGLAAISAEIAGFQQQLPGAKVTVSQLLVTGNHLVFDFALQAASGEVIVSGVDYMQLTEDGQKIKSVIGFY